MAVTPLPPESPGLGGGGPAPRDEPIRPIAPGLVGPPKPEIPPADFAEIGKQVGVGAASSGWIESFWKGAAAWIAEGVATILTWLLSIAKDVAVYIAKIIIHAENNSDAAFAELAAIAVEDLFGIKVDQAAFMGRGGRGARGGVAGAIGNSIIESLFGEYRSGGETSITPSAAAAEHYLGTITQLALEGWLEGWIAEALSAGQLETFAELDDIMAEILGLGRLSRRVMGPPLTMLVVDPFEQLLNETYRPRLLSAGEAIRQFTRGKWTYEQLSRELGRQGYSEERIIALVRNQEKGLSAGDVASMLRRGRWTRAEALEYLQGQGYPLRTAEAELQLARDARLETLNSSVISEAVSAFVNRDLTRLQLRGALEKTTLPADELSVTIAAAEVRQELRVKGLSLGQAEEAYKRGLITLTKFRTILEGMGYNGEDSITLELLMLSELRDEAEAKRKRDELEAARKKREEERAARDRERREEERRRLEDRGLSLAQAEEAVKDGIIPWDRYRAILLRLGYSLKDQGTLIALLEDEIADEEEADEMKAAAEAAREEDKRKREADRKKEKEEREAADEAARRKAEEERKRKEEELEKKAGRSALTMAQFAEIVLKGIRTVSQYKQYLTERGLSQDDVNVLTHLLQVDVDAKKKKEAADKAEALRIADQRAADQAAAAERDRKKKAEDTARLDKADAAARDRRKQIEIELATKRVSLSKSEELVRNEIWKMADYTALLREEGYPEGDVTSLELLLARKIAEDEAAAEARARKDETAARRADLQA